MYVLKELDEIAKEGVEGDLYVAGDLVADGYLKDPAPAAASDLLDSPSPFIVNPFANEEESEYFLQFL